MRSLSASIEAHELISILDILVICGVFFATHQCVVWGRRKHGSGSKTTELILMGRALTLPMFVATMVATWYGGVIGVTAFAFTDGVYSFLTQGVFWYVSYLVFAFVIVPRLHRYRESMSVPEMIRTRLGAGAGRAVAGLNFLNVVPVAYVISMGSLISIFFDVSIAAGSILGLGFVVFYTRLKGLRSVVYSDLVQFIVMYSSVIIATWFLVNSFGGLSFLLERLPESHLSLSGRSPASETIIWGMIAMSTLVDPNFYQRCFAAESLGVAKKGILISCAFWLVFDVCTCLGGLYAAALIPDANPNEAYVNLVMQILPSGLRGFFIAGLLATILSTIDSYLYVAGVSISYDLFGSIDRYAPCVLGTVILALGLSFYFEGSIKDVWKTFGSLSSGSLFLPMVLFLLSPRLVSPRGFLWAVVGSAVTMFVWRLILKPLGMVSLDEFYVGIFVGSIFMFGSLPSWVKRSSQVL